MKPTLDPYRVLGILRGVDQTQSRRPIGGSPSSIIPTAVRPTRTASWLSRRRTSCCPPRAATCLGSAARSGTGSSARYRADRQYPEDGPPRATQERTPRNPASATTPAASGPEKRTWSAEHVPWWGEFEPGTRRDGRAAPEAANTSRPPADRSSRSDATPDAGSAPTMDFDVFDRSSGAAWSSAAQRHFRRGTDDLPSRGAWRYRGTQVVTGAEARKVAAEEDEEGSRS